MKALFDVGTVVTERGTTPFLLSADGRVELGRHHWPSEVRRPLHPDERERLAAVVRAQLGAEAGAVRVGEYFCDACGRWFDVVQEPHSWSLGICMSCSLDRGSEMA